MKLHLSLQPSECLVLFVPTTGDQTGFNSRVRVSSSLNASSTLSIWTYLDSNSGKQLELLMWIEIRYNESWFYAILLVTLLDQTVCYSRRSKFWFHVAQICVKQAVNKGIILHSHSLLVLCTLFLLELMCSLQVIEIKNIFNFLTAGVCTPVTTLPL